MSRQAPILGVLALLAGLWAGTLSSVSSAPAMARPVAPVVPLVEASAEDCDCTRQAQRATERAERLCKDRIERLGGVESPPFPEDLDVRYQPEAIETLADDLRECEDLAEQILVDCNEYPCILLLDGLGSSHVRECGLELDTLFFLVMLEPDTMAPQTATFALLPEGSVGEQERLQLQTRYEARRGWLYEQLQSDTGSP